MASSPANAASPLSSSAHENNAVATAGRGFTSLTGVVSAIPVFVAPLFTDSFSKGREAVQQRKNLFPLLAKQYYPPPTHALNLLKVTFYLLGYSKIQLGNPEAADPAKFSWPHARRLLTPAFVQEMLSFDPSADDEDDFNNIPEYMLGDTLKRVVENLLEKEVMEQGPAFKALLRWGKAAVEIKATTQEQRERTRILMRAGLK